MWMSVATMAISKSVSAEREALSFLNLHHLLPGQPVTQTRHGQDQGWTQRVTFYLLS
jgi:hypothetical protein